MGSVQLPKLNGYVEARRENTKQWRADLACWSEFFDFQRETPKGFSSCFGFPLVRKADAPFELKELTSS